MSQPQSASTRVACEAPAPFDVRTEPSNLSPSYPYIEFDHGRPPLRSDGEEGSSRQPKNEVSPERSYTVSDFKGRNDKERKEFQDARDKVAAIFNQTKANHHQADLHPHSHPIHELKEPETGSEDRGTIDTRILYPGTRLPKNLVEQVPELFNNQWIDNESAAVPGVETVDSKPPPGIKRATKSEEIVTAINNCQDPDYSTKAKVLTFYTTAPPSPTGTEADVVKPLDAPPQQFQSFSGQHAQEEGPKKPKQIRLRRATKPKTPNKLVEDILHLYEHPDSKRVLEKGPLAEAAMTRTAVHLFALEPPGVDEDTSTGVNEDQRRLSATLQAVRSRNSVYEVIWEDKLNITDKKNDDERECETYFDTQPLPNDHAKDPMLVDTNLTAWSWGSGGANAEAEDGTATHSGKVEPKDLLEPSKKQEVEHGDTSSTNGALDLPAADSAEAFQMPGDEPEGDKREEPILDETINIHRRSTAPCEALAPPGAPSKTSPHPLSASSTGIDKETRRRLLGNRKLSNLPPEEERFKSHRNSLMLAHERLFRDDSTVGTESKSRPKGKKNEHGPRERATQSLKQVAMPHQQHHQPPHQIQQLNAQNKATPSEETQPVNAFATRVRTPIRESQGSWLSLTDEQSATSHPAEASARHVERKPSPYPNKSAADPNHRFLTLSPTVHKPANLVAVQAQHVAGRSEESTASGEDNDRQTVSSATRRGRARTHSSRG